MAISDPVTSQKYCSRCGKSYPATKEYFHTDEREKDGFRNPCKVCKGVKNRIRNTAPIAIPIIGAVGLPLTRGLVAVIDECDVDITQYLWHITSHNHGQCFYASARIPVNGIRKSKYLHCLIAERMIERNLLPDERVDHKDGNNLNCRRDNLRVTNHAGNMQNSRRRKNNKSGYKGVWWHKDAHAWQAQIRVNGKAVHLGYFDTPEAAHAAYCNAAKAQFGEFARYE